MSGPPGSPPCDSVRFPTPPDTLLPVPGRSPLWSDQALPSPDPFRLRSNFLVAAKLEVTNRMAHMHTTNAVRFTICLSPVPGGTLVAITPRTLNPETTTRLGLSQLLVGRTSPQSWHKWGSTSQTNLRCQTIMGTEGSQPSAVQQVRQFRTEARTPISMIGAEILLQNSGKSAASGSVGSRAEIPALPPRRRDTPSRRDTVTPGLV